MTIVNKEDFAISAAEVLYLTQRKVILRVWSTPDIPSPKLRLVAPRLRCDEIEEFLTRRIRRAHVISMRRGVHSPVRRSVENRYPYGIHRRVTVRRTRKSSIADARHNDAEV